jgi:hypothetical protein
MNHVSAKKTTYVCLSDRLPACLSVGMIQIENLWTDLDDIWCEF